MNRIVTTLTVALLALPALAGAQDFSIRRMAMGGVILGGRQGGENVNVAYRGMPKPAHAGAAVSLPLGILQTLNDPPTFDPRDPEFNVFRIANLIENPPWNLALTHSAAPSTDISLDISRNSLRMDLGDLRDAFPVGHVRAYGDINGPSLGFSIHRMFIAAAPLVEFENDLHLNDALSGALHDGDSVRADAHYELRDRGRAQAAAALHVGMAAPLLALGGTGTGGGGTLYGGVRAKLLRGLAYGEADNVGAFDTGDTLFGSQSLDLHYTGHYLDAMPGDGGMGLGLDAGAVWALGPLELGLALDDIGTRIHWKVRETLAYRDSATGDLVQRTVQEGRAFTSSVPTTVVSNAAFHAGRWIVAGDVRHNPFATTVHAGLERRTGPLALRAGSGLDAGRRMQLSGGVGVRMGPIGLDLAVATNNRNLENRRAVELGAGLELRH